MVKLWEAETLFLVVRILVSTETGFFRERCSAREATAVLVWMVVSGRA